MEAGNDPEEFLQKVNELVEKYLKTTTDTSVNIYDIARFYAEIYNTYVKFYERLLKKKPPKVDEFAKVLRKELEEKLKNLENKYITFEATVIEDGKPVKKKIQVNAALFLELLTHKLGIAIWDYLAIRMPPPELFMIILQMVEYVAERLAKHETAIQYLIDLIISISNAMSVFVKNLKDVNNKLLEVSETLTGVDKKIRSILEETPKKVDKQIEELYQKVDKRVEEIDNKVKEIEETIKKIKYDLEDLKLFLISRR